MIRPQEITEDILDVMHLVEKDSRITQRLLAKQSGFSIGKVNYCLKALIDIGFVKIRNLHTSKHKINYAYILTPRGIKKKTALTKKFIALKQQEYDKLVSYL